MSWQTSSTQHRPASSSLWGAAATGIILIQLRPEHRRVLFSQVAERGKASGEVATSGSSLLYLGTSGSVLTDTTILNLFSLSLAKRSLASH